jgi:alternative ribosome-rescue factor
MSRHSDTSKYLIAQVNWTPAPVWQIISPASLHYSSENAMSKAKKRPNKAKSIIAQPLFRSRQEQPGKGKGSYRREAFQSKSWEASSVMAA